MVSVCTLTYNQEKYIKQTVESLISQEMDFSFEVVVSDDGSTDKTVAIVQEIIKNHPQGHKIKLLAHENLGVLPNYIYTFKQLKGKYVAFCEGDDYWTDVKKLQRQADFLENNNDYAICCHQVSKVDDDDKFISKAPEELTNETYSIYDLAKGPLMYTPSVMIRFEGIHFPKWYVESPLFDYPLWMFAAKNGKIKYLPFNMANYRVGTGLWTSGHGHTNMKKLEKLLTFLTREFSYDDALYTELERRRKEVSGIVSEHEFYLGLYDGSINLDKVSLKSALNLVARKLKSKISK